MTTENPVPTVDNEALRRLDSTGLANLLKPIPIAALRRILRTPQLGKQLTRTYFAGFRVETIDHARATRFFESAVRGLKGAELAQALLEAWLDAVPAIRDISSAVLGRSNPFSGPVTSDFYDRLEAVVDEACLTTLKTIAPPVEADSTAEGTAAAPGWDSEEADPPMAHDAAILPSTPEPATVPSEMLLPSAADLGPQDAEAMFKLLPRAFDTIVARDRWLWNNLHMVPYLLDKSDEDRLFEVGHHDQNPAATSSTWPEYARCTATELEAAQRWAASQAYWSAAARIWAREGRSQDDNLHEASDSFVRCGCLAADLPVDDRDDELQAIAASGLRSPSTPVREATVMSLVIVAAIDDSVYGEAASGQTVEHLGSALHECLPRLARRFQSTKGTRQMFDAAVREYTARMAELQRLVNEASTSPTIDWVRTQRPKLLQGLADSEQFALPYDNLLLSMTKRLLSDAFSKYDGAADEAADDAYQAVLQGVQFILGEARTTGSELGACLLTPLALAIGSAVNRHYQGIICQKTPDLRVSVVKPTYQIDAERSGLDLQVANEGSGAAEGCTFSIQAPPGAGVSVEPEKMSLGRLDPGKVPQQQCVLLGPPSIESFELSYELEYRDRSGSHTISGVLKASRQHDRDWSELEDRPAPYTMQSITEPERLKGREEQLLTLRRALRRNASYMITGQRRVGKTSLVRVFLAEQALRPDVLGVYVPLGKSAAAAANADLGQVGFDLAARITRAYKDRFGEPRLPLPPLRDFRQSFGNVFSEFVREFSRVHGVRLILAFDDFDELPTARFRGDTGRVFFLALRALIDEGTCFLFVGSERLPKIIAEQAERLNTVNTLEVDYLDSQASAALVREPTRDVLEFSDDAIEEIAGWSARNPYFAMLICQMVWDLALQHRDYCIVRYDIERAVASLVDETKRQHFQHFWSDSPLTDEDDRETSATLSLDIVLALSSQQETPFAYVPRQAIARNCARLKPAEAERYIDDLLDRRVLETSRDRRDLVRFRVPLFARWLKHIGASDLRPPDLTRDTTAPRVVRQTELSSGEVTAAIHGLQYQDRRIGSDEARNWLAQFGDLDDQRLMLGLLRRVSDRGLITVDKFQLALETLFKRIVGRALEVNIATQKSRKLNLSNWYVAHADSPGKSGSAAVSRFCNQNRIPKTNCGTPEKAVTALAGAATGRSILVCVDDFVGTGNSAVEGFNSNVLPLLKEHVRDWQERLLVVYAAVVGLEQGLHYIEDQLGSDVTVFAAIRLTERDKAFSPENDIFVTPEARERARQLASEIGKALESKRPLGYEDSQALIVFPDTVPNNTLPILYKQGKTYNNKPWLPLFPRP